MTRHDESGDIEPFTNPEELTDEYALDIVEESVKVGHDAFEHFAGIDGEIAVGVLNSNDAVLLWTDDDHGWLLPAAPVNPGEDYAAAARGVVESLTDAAVHVTGIECVRKIRYIIAEEGDNRETTAYHVVVCAHSRDNQLPRDPPGTEESEAGWFDTVPDGIHSDAEAADVRLIID